MATKHRIEFFEVTSPITAAVTKFGGQPCWQTGPQWPLSRQTGKPMRFIGQIALDKALFPQATATMAYLFMTDELDGDFVDGTYEPDGGENAVILQPGSYAKPTGPVTDGPTVYRMVEKAGQDRLQPEACEFAVKLVAEPEPEEGILDECKVGGTPVFLQGDEFPFPGQPPLLLQLDAASVPFFVNFGDAGVGYAFLNETGDQAKFLWQCS